MHLTRAPLSGPPRPRRFVRSSASASLALLALLVALTSATSLSGCATIMSGGPDRVSVASNPSGAMVYVDRAMVGMTPTVISLDRAKEKAEIRLELPGFEPVVITREKSLNGWIFGNILIGGLIGIIVDSATNNATKFDDEPIAVGLGANPPPGKAQIDPVTCKRERLRQLQEARAIPDQRERMQAMRAVPRCD